MKLRPYQQRVIGEVYKWFEENPVGNPIVEACVASGKSVIMAALAHDAMTRWVGTRIVVITHQKELLQQNAAKLKSIWPDAPVGVWSAALDSKTIGDITFATIGSVYKHAHLLGKVALVFCDECHLINPKEEGMWRAFLADLKEFGNPGVRVIGFTGTPYRGNGVWLTWGDNALFNAIIARVKMGELLELGFLAPLIPAAAPQLIKTDGVKVIGDDYSAKELAERADQPDIIEAACASLTQLGQNRRCWLVFAINVHHAHAVADEIDRLGISVAVLTGDTPDAERAAILIDYDRGVLRCVVNVGVMTTGIDVPRIDFIVLLRPTRSPVLYVQMAGRGMRVIGGHIAESMIAGKADCLFADYTSTVQTLGPVDSIKGRKGRKAASAGAPFKLCPECGTQNKINAEECSECHFAFDPPAREAHGDAPSGAAMLASQAAAQAQDVFETVDVGKVTYDIYLKPSKKPSMMVTYSTGLMRLASEWVHFEQPLGSPMRMQAKRWWLERTGMQEVPKRASDAIDHLRRGVGIKTPRQLVLDRSGKFATIVRYIFGDEHEQVRGVSAQDGAHSGYFGNESRAEGVAAEAQLPLVRSLSRWQV